VKIAIFISEWVIGLGLANEPHNHCGPLQAGFPIESGLESNNPVENCGSGYWLGRWRQLDFLPSPILIHFNFGNIDRTADQGT
jgi:hypothetical protein